ncbi:MAG: Bug family tripartite tricarboxylate transporter substrate binding protein, partial [Alphaproteobacteria bacterium]
LGAASAPAATQAIDPHQMVLPAAPGGGWDQTGRSREQAKKGRNLVKSVQITNKGGAGGVVGLPEFLNQWKGRPNAIMVAGLVMVGSIITNKAPVTLLSTVPLARLTEEYQVVVAPANSPFKDLRDFAAALKADPAKVPVAGGSAGGTDHITAGLIAKAVGSDARRVAYVANAGGGPAAAMIIGGQVAAGISGRGEFAENIKAGKMKALGISSDKRLDGVDIPTFKEQGIDVSIANWRGVFAPPGVTDAQRKAMIDLVEATVRSAAWKDILEKQDWANVLLTGDAFGAYVQEEFRRTEAVLKDLGLA